MFGCPLPYFLASFPEIKLLEATFARRNIPVLYKFTSVNILWSVTFLFNNRAAKTDITAFIPVTISTIATPSFIGLPSFSPVIFIKPDSACNRKS